VSPSQSCLLPRANRKVYALLAILGGLFAAATLALGLWRYHTYRTAWPYDLAFFNHQLWNLWHGNSPLTLRPVNYYAMEGPEPWRMAQMRLIFLPLGLLYGLWPGVPLLLAVQSVCCGAGVWPMYRMAARRSHSPGYGLLAASAYVLAAPLWLVATTDFRSETLAVPFVLLAIDALDSRSARRFVVWSLVALSCREMLTVVVAAAALALALRRGERLGTKLRWVAGPLALCAAWTGLFLLFLALQHGPDAIREYYRGMRNPDAVGSRIPHPVRTSLAREWPGIVKYQLPLLVAGLGAPELTAVGLAMNYPPLRLGQWSLQPSQHFVRYTLASTMLLLAAVAITLGRIGRKRGREANRVGNLECGVQSERFRIPHSALRLSLTRPVALMLCAAWLAVSTGLLILETLRLTSRLPAAGDRELVRQVLPQIQADETVLAFFDVLPQLSSRTRLYAYEQLPGFGPNDPFSVEAFDQVLADADWCLIESRQSWLIRRIVEGGRFRQVAEGERFRVFRRASGGGT
jgi:hypothetical protein